MSGTFRNTTASDQNTVYPNIFHRTNDIGMGLVNLGMRLANEKACQKPPSDAMNDTAFLIYVSPLEILQQQAYQLLDRSLVTLGTQGCVF